MISRVVLIMMMFGSLSFYEAAASDSTITRLVVQSIEGHGKYKKLAEDAIALLNELFAGQAFKDAIMKQHFDWEEVYINGGEAPSNAEGFSRLFEKNKAATLKLKIKGRRLRLGSYLSGTIGITKAGTNKRLTFKHWLDLSEGKYQCTVIGYASHIAHEYCHQQLFYDKEKRPQSAYRDVVPYAIGDIVCKMLNERYRTACKCDECAAERNKKSLERLFCFQP